MFKYIAVGVVVGLGLLLSTPDAQAGRRRCCCGSAPAPVVVPAPVAAPAPMAQAPQAYRSYSYQPTAQPSYRPYGSWVTGKAYESAVNKALGRGF